MVMLDLLQYLIPPMADLRLDPLRRACPFPLHQTAMLPMQLVFMIAILLDLIPRATRAGLLIMFAAAHGQDTGTDVAGTGG